MIDLIATAAIMLPQDRGFPVSRSQVARYSLNAKELRQIMKAAEWAKTRKARSVVRCESGGNYGINTGNGYYGMEMNTSLAASLPLNVPPCERHTRRYRSCNEHSRH